MLAQILLKTDDQPLDLLDDDMTIFEFEPADRVIRFSDDIHTSRIPSAYTSTPWELT